MPSKFLANQPRIIAICLVALIPILATVACTNAPQNDQPAATTSPPVNDNPALVLTNTPTPTPKNTPIDPTNTATPPPTKTIAPTPTPTIEPTAIPLPDIMIAFAYWGEETNSYQLGVMNSDGSNRIEFPAPTLIRPEEHQTPDFLGNGVQFSWSPDGSLLAFAFADFEDRQRPFQSTFGIISMDDSTYMEYDLKVDNHPGSNQPSYAWSPDGSRLAFASEKELYVMNVDGSGLMKVEEATELIAGFAGVYSPVWSPSGEQILFGLDNELYVFSLNDSSITKIAATPSNAFIFNPNWSPDESWIVFNSQSGGVFLIQNKSPYEMQQISTLWGSGNWNWSSDGATVYGNVFDPYENSPNEPIVFNIIEMSVMADSELQSDDTIIGLSPDGIKMLFQSSRNGTNEIYVSDLDGSNLIQLTQNDTPEKFVSWSTDGTRIIYISNQDGNDEIYSIHIDGTEEKQLTATLVDEFKAEWQPIR